MSSAQVEIIQKVRYSIIVTGLVANFATVLVFSRKAFQSNSIGIYCRALALIDLLLLIVQLINQSFVLFAPSDVFSSISALCKVILYANTALPSISAWILVVLSFDKMLCVIYPHRFEFIRKKSFQLKVMSIISIISLIGYIVTPIFGSNTVKVTTNVTNATILSWQCSLRSLYFYQTFSTVFLVEAFFSPFALMFASSVLIVRGLYKTRKRIEAHHNREMKSRKSKDIKFAISSIVLDFLFIVLTTPQVLSYIITISDKTTLIFFTYITALVYSINFSKSFFAYLISNSIFRKELFKVIRAIKSGHFSDSSTHTTRTVNRTNSIKPYNKAQ